MTDVVARLTAALADRYTIERELGAGGMATVYLAHDLRHDRKVALKVLRPELSAILGGARFLAEIKTTANLQHPHILGLFDSGEDNGTVFYVMPFVDGESLRHRLVREKQLPVDEAIRLAREVADALDYAHQHGIVHRDIKPENILLHGGHALVADFGIALAASRSDGGTRMTETGMSLGTPHYMAPEQAMGEKEITPKADIYALGCVLYEMLTAEPPFTGATAQAIIARVMTEEPRSLTLQRRTIPVYLEAVVGKALEKLPADRFATAGEFAAALGNPAFAAATRSRASSTAGKKPGALRQWAPWMVAAAVAALGAWGTFRPRPLPPTPPVTRFTLRYEGTGRITDGSGSPVAVSPDGSRFAYLGLDSAGVSSLYIRAMDREDPVPIAGTAGGYAPFFSPDGTALGFVQGNRLRKVTLAGGAVTTIADAPTNSAAWGPGDVIYFTTNEGLYRVSAAGGAPQLIAAPDSAARSLYRWPDPLPDGSAVLITLVQRGVPSLAAISLPDGTLHEFGQPGMYPRWVEGGYLAYLQQDGTLFAAAFDARNFRLTSAPVPIAEGVRYGPAFPGKLGISRTGTIAYQAGRTSTRELVIADRTGKLATVAAPGRTYHAPRFSPDGQRLAFALLDFTERAASDLWTYDFRSGTLSRLTFDSSSGNVEWMPNGRRLVYTHRGRVYTIATDGSGVPESLLAVPERNVNEVQLTPDSRSLVFRSNSGDGIGDIWIASLDSARTLRPLLRTPFHERAIALSPDGHWLAYVSDETGGSEVYVRRLEEGSGRWRVSVNGGTEPRWGPGGRELFFLQGDTLLSVGVDPGPEPSFAPARRLLSGDFTDDRNRVVWDVSSDGKRFVFTRSQGQSTTQSLNVVVHWFDQLRARPR